MKIQKILIVGDFAGHFRSQLFIQKLLQKDIGAEKSFVLSFVNPNSYVTVKCKQKHVKFLLNKISRLIFLLELVIKVPFNNKIYFMAMNHRFFPHVLIANFLWRKPIVADMYISVYDDAKNRGIFGGSFVKRLLTLRFEWYYKLLDRLLIEKPSTTIYIGKLELLSISKLVKANIKRCNYKIIPPASLPKKKANPSFTNQFRICWWGTYTPLHGVENIIKTAACLKMKGVDFSLNLFGTPNHDATQYFNMIEELGLCDFVFFHTDKTFGNGLLEEYLEDKCDLSLGNFSSSERALRAVPTKIFDSFSMNIPILTMDTDVLRDSVDVENELFTSTIDPDDISDIIIEIINNPDERKRRADNGYTHYLKTFSVEAVQEQFISLFN